MPFAEKARTETSGTEELLAALRAVRTKRFGWRLVRVHMARLTRPWRQPGHYRSVAGYFHTLIKSTDAQILRPDNGDFVVLIKGGDDRALNTAIKYATEHFAADPLFQTKTDGGPPPPPFVDVHSLDTAYDAVVEMAERMTAETESLDRLLPAEAPATPAAAREKSFIQSAIEDAVKESEALAARIKRPSAPEMKPFGLAELERLETQLAITDAAPFITRKQVVALHGSGQGAPMFMALECDAAAVQAAICPQWDLTGDLWIQQRLNALFDQMTLRAVRLDPWPECAAVALTVSTSLVESSLFFEFEEARKRLPTKPTILEFRFTDVNANGRKFLKLAEGLRARGYRIGVREIGAYGFCISEMRALGTDFVRIGMTPADMRALSGEWYQRWLEAVARDTRARVILDGCTEKDLIEFGLRTGISLFAGPAITSQFG
jgi:hypothetical protein